MIHTPMKMINIEIYLHWSHSYANMSILDPEGEKGPQGSLASMPRGQISCV